MGLEGLEKMNLLNKRLKMVESIRNGINGLEKDDDSGLGVNNNILSKGQKQPKRATCLADKEQ